ncbi:sulfotransferase domain-containing protein [Acaryochloris sp. CCMEE 5410]|uniref:sulfotransferase domain-containing protein n=1 Tax=Acaryochloris sp. CCMEE 5410 TaxID=310037 RepID=UPI0002D6B64F|nr:sulfotransferase domain-containing protein [Acaryochloris sp. CCMEE 5410]KAI9135021.1 sulfotransferase domain-containing protein [Acaryochloris sp. CCMEE 5410]
MKITRILNKIDRRFHPSHIYALQPDHDLLRENRTYREAKDIVLLSYPRSGNTWLRRLLANSILEAQQYPSSIQSDIPFETVVPSIYTQSIKPPCLHRYDEVCHRIVKSHEHRDARKHKTVYLFRNPVDTLVSWHHFVSNSPSLLQQFPWVVDLSIDEFCLNAVDGWAKHIQQTRHYKDILLVEYEHLFQYPHQMLANILDFCRIPRSNIDLDQIIDNQSIRKLKSVTHSQELRKGGVGHGEVELRPSTVTELRQYQQMLNVTWKPQVERSLMTTM